MTDHLEYEDTRDDIMTYLVAEEDDRLRLDKFLSARAPDISRTRLKSLILGAQVRIDDELCDNPSLKISAGQSVQVDIPPAQEYHLEPENIPLDIIYEDDDLLVINKDVGMVVHPGAGNWTGTLVHALLYHCGKTLSGIGGLQRPGIVHRLDKDTSGLMMVAKNDQAHAHLSAQLSDRSLSRTYHALVVGTLQPRRGAVDMALGRHPRDRVKIAVRQSGGREARTFYNVIEQYGTDALSLVECKLDTGRTHQIRVHMEALKHPLIGDPLYGAQPTFVRALLKKNNFEKDIQDMVLGFPRQALHAKEISFIHPRRGETLDFVSDYPADFQALLNAVK